MSISINTGCVAGALGVIRLEFLTTRHSGQVGSLASPQESPFSKVKIYELCILGLLSERLNPLHPRLPRNLKLLHDLPRLDHLVGDTDLLCSDRSDPLLEHLAS